MSYLVAAAFGRDVQRPPSRATGTGTVGDGGISEGQLRGWRLGGRTPDGVSGSERLPGDYLLTARKSARMDGPSRTGYEPCPGARTRRQTPVRTPGETGLSQREKLGGRSASIGTGRGLLYHGRTVLPRCAAQAPRWPSVRSHCPCRNRALIIGSTPSRKGRVVGVVELGYPRAGRRGGGNLHPDEADIALTTEQD